MMPTARVLANVVDQLDDISMADSDTKGDLGRRARKGGDPRPAYLTSQRCDRPDAHLRGPRIDQDARKRPDR